LTEIIPEGAVPAPVSPQNNLKHFLLDLLETIGLAVLLFLAINAVSARVRVDGYSMRPTLENGEFVLVNRLAYRFGQPQRGDIIVFRSTTAQEDLIKRVIGLPGETVNVEGGIVSVNGVPLHEQYIAAPPAYTTKWDVPAGFLFVLGDNRNDSSDSHSWGLLPVGNVVGKAILVYWPLAEWMVIQHSQPALAAPK
jgi:signal peptidase I